VSRRTAAAVLALVALSGLAGCGGEDERDPSSKAPLEVSVGDAFTWNDFTIEDGWTVKGVERSVDLETVTTPEVSGTLVNNSSEERAAIFQLVFSVEGDPEATVNCSAPTMVEDQSMQFLCPGVNTTMPEDYDTVTVMEFVRDTGGSDSDESGT
jgi:hypothetical protein